MLISKHFTFEASHILPRHPGKCSRLHGHSWRLTVTVAGEVNKETLFVMDYAELSKLVNAHVITPLDHSHLGQGKAYCYAEGIKAPEGFEAEPYLGIDFYPSSENLCRAVFKLLKPLVRELAPNVRLFEVRIAETCTAEACWRLADEPAFAD